LSRFWRGWEHITPTLETCISVKQILLSTGSSLVHLHEYWTELSESTFCFLRNENSWSCEIWGFQCGIRIVDFLFSEFLATDPVVPGSIPGATTFSEK
jgi:hypothetical protein